MTTFFLPFFEGQTAGSNRWSSPGKIWCSVDAMSSEIKPGWLFYIGDEISYPVIWGL